jgi:hypothetical protein
MPERTETFVILGSTISVFTVIGVPSVRLALIVALMPSDASSVIAIFSFCNVAVQAWLVVSNGA